MPRILRIMNRLAVGGPILNATYLTKYLAPDFETLLVVGEKEDHEQSADFITQKLGLEYKTIPAMGRSIKPAADYKAYKELKSLIRNFKPDIVHTHAAKPGALGRLAAAATGVPVVVHTFHGHVFHSYFSPAKTQFYIRTERFLGKRSDAIIAISEQQKKELVEEFRIAPENKFHVIPLGFDLDKFRTEQEEKRISFRKELALADDEIAIGIIGRLVPIKNHSLFLRAIRYVMDSSSQKIKAIIIGDGETRQQLEQTCRELNVKYSSLPDTDTDSPVIFTSWRSDVDRIYAGLDIVCLTSLNEGTPVSLIEAQAADKPVVSTRVGGIGDIVVENSTALLSDIHDEEQFCKNLLRLVNDGELRKKMGEDSHHHVLEKFSYQRLVRDVSKLYHDLLTKKKA